MSAVRAHMRGLKAPGHHDKVYKDECMFSFSTPESPGGLYINLRTFQVRTWKASPTACSLIGWQCHQCMRITAKQLAMLCMHINARVHRSPGDSACMGSHVVSTFLFLFLLLLPLLLLLLLLQTPLTIL